MKKYIYGMMFIFSLSLCAAQDEGDKKSSVAEESAQASKQAELNGKLKVLFNTRNAHLYFHEMETLLQQGADKNYVFRTRDFDISLLDVAADNESNPIGLVELLLKYKADTGSTNRRNSVIIERIQSISLSPKSPHDQRFKKIEGLITWDQFNRKRKTVFEVIELLLRYNADINVRELTRGSENTALIIAAKNNDPEAVAFLLDHGADDTLVNKEGKTFHDFAVKHESIFRTHQAWAQRVQQKVDEVLPQLPQTVSECITSKLGITGNDLALMAAIEHGDADDVEAELKRGADPCTVLESAKGLITDCPALYFALLKDDRPDKIKVLLHYGANANQKVGHYVTIDQIQTRRMWGNCLSALLHESNWNNILLQFNQIRDIVTDLKLLVEHGLDVNDCNYQGVPPLVMLTSLIKSSRQLNHILSVKNGCKILEFIVEQGADTASLFYTRDLEQPDDPQIEQILQQSKSKRLSAIDQSLQYMPAAVVNLIGQYSDCCLLEQPKKEKPDAGDEKEC